MGHNLFGWDLPPGVTLRDIDEAAGVSDDEAEEDAERAAEFPDDTMDYADMYEAAPDYADYDEDGDAEEDAGDVPF